ncbi:hypothetical protein Nit79A3_3504 [Nitrosomonas sp. Is79A3]
MPGSNSHYKITLLVNFSYSFNSIITLSLKINEEINVINSVYFMRHYFHKRTELSYKKSAYSIPLFTSLVY